MTADSHSAETDDPLVLEEIALAAVARLVRYAGAHPGALVLHGLDRLRLTRLHQGRLDGLEDTVRRLDARVVVLIEGSAETAFDLEVTAVAADLVLSWQLSVAFDNRDWRIVDVAPSSPRASAERLRELVVSRRG